MYKWTNLNASPSAVISKFQTEKCVYCSGQILKMFFAIVSFLIIFSVFLTFFSFNFLFRGRVGVFSLAGFKSAGGGATPWLTKLSILRCSDKTVKSCFIQVVYSTTLRPSNFWLWHYNFKVRIFQFIMYDIKHEDSFKSLIKMTKL